jgi:hypothetical protein
MRCHICDERLDPKEIRINPNTGRFDPCGVCLTVSKETLKGYDVDDPTREGGISSDEIKEFLT